MWDLIVSVPDHCLSFYFATTAGEKHAMSVPNILTVSLVLKIGTFICEDCFYSEIMIVF